MTNGEHLADMEKSLSEKRKLMEGCQDRKEKQRLRDGITLLEIAIREERERQKRKPPHEIIDGVGQMKCGEG